MRRKAIDVVRYLSTVVDFGFVSAADSIHQIVTCLYDDKLECWN